MIDGVADPVTRALLDDWQRDFPITPRPFATIAQSLGTEESDVIARLRAQAAQGRVSRVGATVAPNTISASTLAAMAVPDDRIEEVAALVNSEPGVNHNYLREDDWNLWFVVTGPDRAHVDATLARIGARSNLRVLDLPLVRAFNVDLGFRMTRAAPAAQVAQPPDTGCLNPGDRSILQALLRGLPLVPSPYTELAVRLGIPEAALLARIRALSAGRVLSRLGVIIRHRAVGWRANAMVVWDLDHDSIDRAGPLLTRQPGVTLCYERSPVPGIWGYRLFCMIHARSRAEALGHLAGIRTLPEFADTPHRVLFSLHCYRQTGALITDEKGAA